MIGRPRAPQVPSHRHASRVLRVQPVLQPPKLTPPPVRVDLLRPLEERLAPRPVHPPARVPPARELQTAPQRVVRPRQVAESFVATRRRRELVGAHLSKDRPGDLVRQGVEVEQRRELLRLESGALAFGEELNAGSKLDVSLLRVWRSDTRCSPGILRESGLLLALLAPLHLAPRLHLRSPASFRLLHARLHLPQSRRLHLRGQVIGSHLGSHLQSEIGVVFGEGPHVPSQRFEPVRHVQRGGTLVLVRWITQAPPAR